MTSSHQRFISVQKLSTLVAVSLLLASCQTNEAKLGGRSAQTEEIQVAPSSDVSRLQAFRDAEFITSRQAGRSSAVGSGVSMAPIYGGNTMLVIAPIDYFDLEAGMSVVYRNSRGLKVVHQLLELTRSGWRVQGLNNELEDHDRVTRENLLGVVYASLGSALADAPSGQ